MRYIGGKTKIGKEIAKVLKSYLSDKITTYIEPFCGMLGVMKHMTNSGDIDYVASDISEDIILLWNSVKDNSFQYTEINRELYYDLKKSEPSALRAFAGYGCSYGGAFFNTFEEFRGDNNRRNDITAYNSLYKIDIQDIKFIHSDYKHLKVNENCLVYCDPPYKKTAQEFGGNSSFNSEEFWDTMRLWRSQGITVIISEYEAPDDFKCIWERKRYSPLKKVYRTEKLFI